MEMMEKRTSNALRNKKSTLTQQQKNKKRQRATPKQLNVLRNEFLVNSTPNARTREEIGRKIDMTERSVQIWFQNKRAKAKQFARKSTNTGYSTMTPYISTSGLSGYYANPPLISPVASQNNGATDISFPCTSLTVGSWHRVITSGPISSDLNMSFSFLDSSFNYTFFANSTGFQVRFSLDVVKEIHYTDSPESLATGLVYIHLNRPPTFYIQTSNMVGTWIPCDDFSEMKQASHVLVHKLSGPGLQLMMQVLQIASIAPHKVTGAYSDRSDSYSDLFISVDQRSTRASSVVDFPIKTKTPSVTSFTQHMSVPPMKQRSRSMPTIFSDDEMLQQESDDELFLIDTSLVSSNEINSDIWTSPTSFSFSEGFSKTPNLNSYADSTPVSPVFVSQQDDDMIEVHSNSTESCLETSSPFDSSIFSTVAEVKDHSLLDSDLLLTSFADMGKIKENLSEVIDYYVLESFGTDPSLGPLIQV